MAGCRSACAARLRQDRGHGLHRRPDGPVAARPRRRRRTDPRRPAGPLVRRPAPAACLGMRFHARPALCCAATSSPRGAPVFRRSPNRTSWGRARPFDSRWITSPIPPKQGGCWNAWPQPNPARWPACTAAPGGGTGASRFVHLASRCRHRCGPRFVIARHRCWRPVNARSSRASSTLARSCLLGCTAGHAKISCVWLRARSDEQAHPGLDSYLSPLRAHAHRAHADRCLPVVL